MTTSFNRLAAARPHSDPHVEASDPDIIMRRLATSERTMTPAMASRRTLTIPPQLKGRLTIGAVGSTSVPLVSQAKGGVGLSVDVLQ